MAATGEPVWPDPWSDELQALRVGFAQTLKEATAQLLNGKYARRFRCSSGSVASGRTICR